MNQNSPSPPSWLSTLSTMIKSSGAQELDVFCRRVLLVARTKWIMLAMLGGYGLCAGISYALSSVGFCFTVHQTTFLVLTAFAVVVCNLVICRSCGSAHNRTSLIHIQVGLDLVFVTVLIHFTGGIVSWFWPVYLLVTLEAAFLFEDRRDVWLIGTLGAALYGALLIAESFHLLPAVAMPFVGQSLHGASLFQVLMWLWVAGMNATVAVIAAKLMDTIRRDHRKLKESEEALFGFISTASDLIFCCDVSGTILYANQVCRDRLRFDLGEYGHHLLRDMVVTTDRERFNDWFRKVQVEGHTGHIEVRFIGDGAEHVDVEMSLTPSARDDQAAVIWGVGHDITERKQAQQELYKLAHHDILTGLPNRVLLQDRLHQARALSQRMASHLAMLFLDLDRFKIINDTLGHSVGDELLRLVAGRLKRSLRETDTIARIGGDEFVILLVNVRERHEVTLLAEKILKSLSLPFNLRDHELFITTSIGICMYPDDEQDSEVMMKKADIAMYHAKAVGRNNFQFYNEAMDQNASRRFVISNSLRRALECNEFTLHYQPKIDISSNSIVALEALIRWNHPELGLLSPVEFIQVAEESGLIMQLGEWVLREACRQTMLWHSEGIDAMRIAVNLSGYQLQHKDLLTSVKTVLAETGMNPDNLEFEITESVIMQNPDFAVDILSEISSLGIHISIDDFGTGYSSLAHLKRFAVNTLKIDKSFVRDVDVNATDAAIASAIIAMGSSLKLNVIAEGVETQAQFDFLKKNKCDQVQGFLFSKPLPAKDVLALVRENRRDGERSAGY